MTSEERDLGVEGLDNIAADIRDMMVTLLLERYGGIHRLITQGEAEDPGAPTHDEPAFAKCVIDALLKFLPLPEPMEGVGELAKKVGEAIGDLLKDLLTHAAEAALSEKASVQAEPSLLLRFFRVQQLALSAARKDAVKAFSQINTKLELAARQDPSIAGDAAASLKQLYCNLEAQSATAGDDQYWASLQAWCVYLAQSSLGDTAKGAKKSGVQIEPDKTGEAPIGTDMSGTVAFGPVNALSDGWSELAGGVIDLTVAIDWPVSTTAEEIPYSPDDVPTVPRIESTRIVKVHTAFYQEIARHRIGEMRIPIRIRIPEYNLCIGRDENGLVCLDGSGAGSAFLGRLGEGTRGIREAIEGARYIVTEIGKLTVSGYASEP